MEEAVVGKLRVDAFSQGARIVASLADQSRAMDGVTR